MYNVWNIRHEALRNNGWYRKRVAFLHIILIQSIYEKKTGYRQNYFLNKKEMRWRDCGLPCWCYHYDYCTLFSPSSFPFYMAVYVCSSLFSLSYEAFLKLGPFNIMHQQLGYAISSWHRSSFYISYDCFLLPQKYTVAIKWFVYGMCVLSNQIRWSLTAIMYSSMLNLHFARFCSRLSLLCFIDIFRLINWNFNIS